MREVLSYVLSLGFVSGEDVPLWLAALLICGLLGASALIGLGVFQWFHGKRRRRAGPAGPAGSSRIHVGPVRNLEGRPEKDRS